jgi:transporter family protein
MPEEQPSMCITPTKNDLESQCIPVSGYSPGESPSDTVQDPIGTLEAEPAISTSSHDITSSGGKLPPLTVWIVPALSCALAYALYNIFIKKGSASINPVLGGVILQSVAALLGMLLFFALLLRKGAEKVLVYDGMGIGWSIMAGVSVAVAEIVSFFVSSLGVQSMQSIPITIGGSVVFGTAIGAVVLKEKLTYN